VANPPGTTTDSQNETADQQKWNRHPLEQPGPSWLRLGAGPGLGDDLRGLAKPLEHVPRLGIARPGRQGFAQMSLDLLDQLVAPGTGQARRGFFETFQVVLGERME
jgi:hypothetical protein